MKSVDKSSVNKQALLTIAIPTYNRASYLDLCLKRISEEIANLSEDQRCLVTVYVSDNASEDNTSQVISQYESLNPDRYEVIKNEVNVGPDRNITQCYVAANTPYVWVLGDDDVILQGGLQLILDVLASQTVDILYINGYGFSEHYLDEPKRGRRKSGVTEYSSALDFVTHTHVMLTFLTALIVRGGVNVAVVDQLVGGTNLTQLAWVLPLVRDGKKFAIMEDRIYAAKMGNSGGYGAVKVFGNNFRNIANSILINQPKVAQAIQNGTLIMWFPAYIISLRKGDAGYLKEDVAIEMKRLFKGNWRYHFFLVPLIYLPFRLAIFYFVFVRLTRKLLESILI